MIVLISWLDKPSTFFGKCARRKMMSKQAFNLVTCSYNNKLTKWDYEDHHRTIDFVRHGLRLEPVSASDSGIYKCIVNNGKHADSGIVLKVQGKDEVSILQS